jgi:parallel beta-helix repeat protein
MRPKLIEFYNSSNIVIKGITAQNSPNWCIHPYASTNITIQNTTVLAPREVGNTDGIDPNSCTNVLIESCYIDVGDDGISIKVRSVACVLKNIWDFLVSRSHGNHSFFHS